MVFCFDLSGSDLPTHGASCCALSWCLWRDELRMNKGAPTWFETFWSCGVKAIDYWTIFSNNVFGKSKLKKKIIGIWRCSWCLLKSSWGVRFNRVYFTIFRAKMREILIFEWILLLEIRTNCKKIVWKEKLVESSMCSHCRILKFLILKCEKYRICSQMGQPHRLH
jgi:hypothetical protein